MRGGLGVATAIPTFRLRFYCFTIAGKFSMTLTKVYEPLLPGHVWLVAVIRGDMRGSATGPQRTAAVSRRAAARAALEPNSVIVTTPSIASRPTPTVPDQPATWKAVAPTVLPTLEPM